MKSLRHIGFLLCLAFALAIGQQGALLHALGHATEQVQKGDSKPAKAACDQCALAGQPWGTAAAGMPPIPVTSGAIAAMAFVERVAPARSSIVFLSRAPPVLS
jgi:hypothetical protein